MVRNLPRLQILHPGLQWETPSRSPSTYTSQACAVLVCDLMGDFYWFIPQDLQTASARQKTQEARALAQTLSQRMHLINTCWMRTQVQRVVKVYHTAQTFQPYLPPKKGEVWKVSLLRLGWESTHLCVADGTWSPQGATLWTCLWGINWGRRITLSTGT